MVSLFIQLIQPSPKLVSVKLDDGNFLTLKQQVFTAILGHGLENFITRISAFPPQLINNESGISTPKPDFIARQRQDQLLTSWLLSSIN